MQKSFLRQLIVCLVFLIPIQILASEGQPTIARVTREEILFTKIPVVTAAKKIQKSGEAPAAISVITAEQIRNSGARTIAEAIQYVAGLNVFGFQGVNIRGVGSAGRILLLVDGRRNNDVFSGGFEIGFERSVEKVKQIEIIKGPASSLYGSNAFAGIINIITKTGADQDGIVAKADAGNFSTQDYYLTWGHDTKAIDAYISLYAHFDEGTDVVATNDSTDAGDIFGKVKWKDFTFSSGYRPNRTEVPAIGGILTPEAFTKRNDSFGLVQYQKTYGTKWNFFSQFGTQNELLFFNGRLLKSLDISDFRAEGEARANYIFNDRDDITFGAELRHDRTRNTKTAAEEIYSSDNRSAYIDNELRLTPRIILSTGVRLDNNSVFGNSGNPRAGLIINARENTIFKFFAGTAFRGPDFVDLFTDVPVGGFLIKKNPDLKPEKVRSLEAEVSHAITGSLRVRVNVYHNSLQDLISVTIKNLVATFANLGDASAYGLETGLEGKLSDNLDFSINHALQYAHDNVSDQDLTLVPRNTVNGSISYSSPRGFRVGFYNKYVGSRPAINALTGNRITLDSYLKSDLILSLDLSRNLQLQTGVYNLFDVDYISDFATPQRGIQVLAGISYRTK